MNRRRLIARIGLPLLAALVLAAAVLGGYAWGNSSAPGNTPVAQASTPTPSKSATKSSAKHAAPVRGSLTAVDGDSWTLQTAHDGTLTVTVGADTKFGTAKAPAARPDFTVGKQVVVTGTRTGTTVNATRIAVPQTKPSATPTPTPAPTPTS